VAARFPVITGLGIIAAPGCGVDEVWRAIEGGVSGLKPLTLFQSPRYGQIPTGEVQCELTELGAPLQGSRSDRLGWVAAREALRSSALDLSACADRAGVILGTSVGGSFDSERFLTTLIKQGRIRARPTRFHECVSAVTLIADEFGLFGPSFAVATACSSSALAIAAAAEMIMSGEAEVMLTGGADSLSHMTWGGFHSLLLVDAEGCRPFDANRAGTSLGEGAAVLVLEAEEFARRRGAKILARLSGWGTSCDAYHSTAPHPEGLGAIAAMQSALRRAGLEAQAIDYVNAHGTGTRDNDVAEATALKSVFNGHLPPVSSTKRFFGHALAVSGAIEAVVCVEALRRQELPPNIGFNTPDPAICLKPVTALRPAPLAHVMSNSFGFGGNNVVLIFSRPDMPALTRPPRPVEVAVGGLSVIGPGELAVQEIGPPLPPGKAVVHSCGPLVDTSLLQPNQKRRLSRLHQMALITALRSHAPDASQRVAVAIGTGLGCLEDAGAFIENLIAKDEREPMPARFPNAVHNAAAAQVAISQGAHGMNSSPTAGEITFESALWQGMSQLANDEVDCALVGAVDQLDKYLLSIGQRWGAWTEKTKPGEGAMVASLARAEKVAQPLAKVTAVKLGRYRRPFDAEREADWVAAAVDLTKLDVILTGENGWPKLDEMYEAVVPALSARAGRTLKHHAYKQLCGEFHAASAFGFSVAVGLARQQKASVLLYTLSLRGAKALCCVRP
jgi:3-oxoacyl-(acyl-carrier-protein) synthase